ncbi:MAG: DUF4292 domain-containing protein [Bacteroidota bacterium]
MPPYPLLQRTRWLIVLSCLLHACRSVLPQKSLTTTPAVASLAFDYLRINARLRYQDQQHQYSNASVQVRIQKGTCIWFSITAPLGIEIMRGTITPSGITVVNHSQKTYASYTYTTLSARWHYHINYAWIQAVLLGELLLPPAPQEILYQGPDKAILQQQRPPWILTHIINTTWGQPEKLVVLDTLTQQRCVVAYQGWQQYTPGPFFRQVKIQLYRSARQVRPQQTLMLRRIRIHRSSKPLSFPFSIPPTYAQQ